MLLAVALVDWLVVGVYGAFVVAVGMLSKKKQEDADDYLLDGGRLPWRAIEISLIATSFSSLSLLGMTGLAYTTRFRWFQLQLGDLLGITIVSLVFLPFFAARKQTTAYEFLEARFGRPSRWVASAMFHVLVLARAGLLLYATAAAGAALLGIQDQLPLVILTVGIAAIAYSAVGGLGAVVWTDTVQLALVFIGVGACFAIAVNQLPGGFADIVAWFDQMEGPAFIDTSTDLGTQPTLLSCVVAYGVLALSVFGTNQQTVQRYLACRDLSEARRAAFLGWAVGAVVVFLTMGLGIAIAAVYQGADLPPNGELAAFMRDFVPPGLTGVLIAAILAASMWSMDSAIHSMATASLVDFVEPLRKHPFRSDAARLRAARGLTVLHGVLAVVAAFYASTQGENVIQVLVRWLALLSGPILGLFLLGMLTRRPRQGAALGGLAAGYFVAAALNFGPTAVDPEVLRPIWTAPLALAATLVVAAVVAFLAGSQTPSDPSRAFD